MTFPDIRPPSNTDSDWLRWAAEITRRINVISNVSSRTIRYKQNGSGIIAEILPQTSGSKSCGCDLATGDYDC